MTDVLDWVAARALDAKLAGDTVPGWMAFVGLLLFGAGAAVLAVLVVRAADRRRSERERPEPGDLLDARPWLAIDPYTVEPTREVFYRGKRRAPRTHVVPAHPARVEELVTELIPRISDDVEATAVIPGGGAQ